jgi:hypothetical protein
MSDFMLKKIAIFEVIFSIILITILIGAWANLEEGVNITPPAQDTDQKPVMVYGNFATRDNSSDNDDIESIDEENDIFYYLFGPLCPLWIFILVVVGIISYVYHWKYKPDNRPLPPGPPPGQTGYSSYPQNTPYPPPPPPPPPTQNLCSYCQQPLTFVSQHQKWYCNYCRRYV